MMRLWRTLTLLRGPRRTLRRLCRGSRWHWGKTWRMEAAPASPSSRCPSRSRRGTCRTAPSARASSRAGRRLRRSTGGGPTLGSRACGSGLFPGLGVSGVLFLPFFWGGGVIGEKSQKKKNVQVSRARIVRSSSPTRRIGSTRNLAPSSSPTSISPPTPAPSGVFTWSLARVVLSGRARAVMVIGVGGLLADSASRRAGRSRMRGADVDAIVCSVLFCSVLSACCSGMVDFFSDQMVSPSPSPPGFLKMSWV